MQQLSGLDASFLYTETGSTFGHVCMVALLDADEAPAELTLEVVQSVLAQRLHLLPPLRRRLVEVPFGIDRPYWAEDPGFDLDFHVRELALPSPGNRLQLAEQVARIASRPLDRSKPLWELYLITGLEAERVALMVKFHHAAMDGVAGAELMTVLLDHSPEGPDLSPAPHLDPTGRAEPLPGELQMWLRGVAGATLQPLRALDYQRRVLATLPRYSRYLARTGRAALAQAAGWGDPAGSDGGLLGWPALIAPRTSFNRPITPHRRWAVWTVTSSSIDDRRPRAPGDSCAPRLSTG